MYFFNMQTKSDHQNYRKISKKKNKSIMPAKIKFNT